MQLHAVIRAARRETGQTHTVRLSPSAYVRLHDLATREQLTLSETIERYLAPVTTTPSRQESPPAAVPTPVLQPSTRMGTPQHARAAVAPQKRRRAFVTTKKGVCYLTVKISREHCHLMRIYNYTIAAQNKRDLRRRHPDVDFDWQNITRQLAEKRAVCRRYRARRRTSRAPRMREPFYGVIDPIERTVYVNDPSNIAGTAALLDAIIAGRL
jgi:hypothetical protein